MFLNESTRLCPKFPVKIEGSVEVSYLYSPGSAHNSTTLPCSTMIIHCPSATAINEPFEIMFSLPLVLDERLELTLFCPLTTSVLLSIESQ